MNCDQAADIFTKAFFGDGEPIPSPWREVDLAGVTHYRFRGYTVTFAPHVRFICGADGSTLFAEVI